MLLYVLQECFSAHIDDDLVPIHVQMYCTTERLHVTAKVVKLEPWWKALNPRIEFRPYPRNHAIRVSLLLEFDVFPMPIDVKS